MLVIDPQDIEPTVNPASAEHRDGRQVHRRILSPMRGGPASMDLGYNRSAAGLDYAQAYAYDRDEFCYTAAGTARMVSDGETVDFSAGVFMWRPAGAATQRFTVLSAYNSICAFGPARGEGWEHLLPASYHDGNDGAADRPRVQFRRPTDVQPLTGTAPGITHRVIFDTKHMAVSHITLARGTQADLRRIERDEIYFLESGSLAPAGGMASVEQGQFIFFLAGQDCAPLVAESDCVVIHWSAAGLVAERETAK